MKSGATKYEPLVSYLAMQQESGADCTFAKLEEIVGFPLPRMARTMAGFWTDRQRPHVRAWEGTGWRARLDFPNRRVIFHHNERHPVVHY